MAEKSIKTPTVHWYGKWCTALLKKAIYHLRLMYFFKQKFFNSYIHLKKFQKKSGFLKVLTLTDWEIHYESFRKIPNPTAFFGDGWLNHDEITGEYLFWSQGP